MRFLTLAATSCSRCRARSKAQAASLSRVFADCSCVCNRWCATFSARSARRSAASACCRRKQISFAISVSRKTG
ncbi:hypothetical protein PSI23_18870 [Xenorhabdus sp. XENO-10]|uniref:Secreted protein n=1 Tax=Xenorhabdus yunnanensis TaxID=3025878 RepID=A0ABT5LJK5_9GAMM|nr:hypothetical protein [Xenorhabdus yunnanensis]MDC9591293.1 hypothetical protein [Xenorhabdus yunnanensis]